MADSRRNRDIRPQALRTGGKREYGEYSRGEIVSMIVHLYYFDGLTQERIAEELKSKGVEFPRNAIADCLREVREQGRLRYVPPLESMLGLFIAERSPQLHDVWVVETAEPCHIGRCGAEMLLALLRQHKRDTRRDEVHVGFAGGRTPNLMAQALADLLAELETRPKAEVAQYPRCIFFHSLIGTVNLVDASVDPNSYSIHFAAPQKLCEWSYFQLRFSSFPLPGLVLKKERQRVAKIKTMLQDIVAVRDVVDPVLMARKLDCIVMSCGHWGERHKSFVDHVFHSCEGMPDLQKAWKETRRQLEEKKVIGDVAWCPIGPDGPIEEETELWVEKLFGIRELSQLAHPPESSGDKASTGRSKIIMLAGPCSGCNQPKGDLLRSILSIDPPPLTHLIVDTRTADEYRQLVEGKVSPKK